MDGMTKEMYKENLKENIRELIDCLKRFKYIPQLVRRTYMRRGSWTVSLDSDQTAVRMRWYSISIEDKDTANRTTQRHAR